MKLDPNDPRLTAYALGELDETEQAAIERDLLHSDAARQTVEEIRETAKLLKEDLSNEPGLQLSEAQRSSIERKFQPGKGRGLFAPSRALYAGGALLAAASLFLVVYLKWSDSGKSLENAVDSDRNGRIIGRGNSPSTVVQEFPKPVEVIANRNHPVQQTPNQASTKNPVVQIAKEKQRATIGTELIVQNEAASQSLVQAGQIGRKES